MWSGAPESRTVRRSNRTYNCIALREVSQENQHKEPRRRERSSVEEGQRAIRRNQAVLITTCERTHCGLTSGQIQTVPRSQMFNTSETSITQTVTCLPSYFRHTSSCRHPYYKHSQLIQQQERSENGSAEPSGTSCRELAARDTPFSSAFLHMDHSRTKTTLSILRCGVRRGL